MFRFAAILSAAIAVSNPLSAQTCPEAADHVAEVDALVAQIQKAETEQEARAISNQMWELWTDAPGEQAQALLDRGMRRREAWDLLGALETFNTLVEFCPAYAEGYNQRAFVNFLRQNFSAALVDLDAAIALSPNHVAALSGRALTLLGLGRTEEAREALTEALVLNPWLPERHLLAPGGLLAPPGEDI